VNHLQAEMVSLATKADVQRLTTTIDEIRLEMRQFRLMMSNKGSSSGDGCKPETDLVGKLHPPPEKVESLENLKIRVKEKSTDEAKHTQNTATGRVEKFVEAIQEHFSVSVEGDNQEFKKGEEAKRNEVATDSDPDLFVPFQDDEHAAREKVPFALRHKICSAKSKNFHLHGEFLCVSVFDRRHSRCCCP